MLFAYAMVMLRAVAYAVNLSIRDPSPIRTKKGFEP